MDFRRCSWTPKGRGSARPVRELPSRMTIIAAIDNLGNSYLAVSTANTDSDTFVTFLYYLAAALDQEDSNWRKSTAFLLDNASYHRSDDTRAAVKKLGLRVIFSGPYSYTAAPIETYFAQLKAGNLNPDRIAVGKR